MGNDFDNFVEGLKSLTKSALGNLAVLLAILVILGGIFRATCVTFVDNYEVAYEYHMFAGDSGKNIKVIIDDKTKEYQRGWIIRLPFIVKVNTIDLRPMQVTLNANNRVLNAKLVQFNPAGIELFLSWHGRDNYEGPGNNNVTTPFSEILKSYAYDDNEYPFLTILRNLKNEKVIVPAMPAVAPAEEQKGQEK